jgi:hypothetical protein
MVSPRQGNMTNGIEDHGTTLMDIEEGTLQKSKVLGIQDSVSSHD